VKEHVGRGVDVKASRMVPLLPERRAILTEAFEAAEDGAAHVVGKDTYRQAAGTPGGWRSCKAVQGQVQLSDDSGANSSAAACRSDPQEVARNDISPCKTRAYAKSCDALPRPARIISREDRTRTPLENTGNSRFFAEGAANSGAVADAAVLAADLARIVAVWPMLSTPIRRAMLALLDCEP
jgi:hypothetical protein